MLRKLLFKFCLLLISAYTYAQINIDSDFEIAEIEINDLSYAELTSFLHLGTQNPTQLTEQLAGLNFSPLENADIESLLGGNRSIFLKFKVRNLDQKYQQLFLEIGNSHIEKIIAFASGSVIGTGDEQPFYERPIKHRNFIFPIELSSGKSEDIVLFLPTQLNGLDKFIPVLNEPAPIPLTLWSPDALASRDQFHYVFFGFFFGFSFFFLIATSLLRWERAPKRQISFLLFIANGVLLALVFTGLGYQYFWFWSPYIQHISRFTFTLSFFLFAIYFYAGFFRIPEYLPNFYKYIRVFSIIIISFIIASLCLPYLPLKNARILVATINVVLLLSVVLLIAMRLLIQIRGRFVESSIMLLPMLLLFTGFLLALVYSIFNLEFDYLYIFIWAGAIALLVALGRLLFGRIITLLQENSDKREKLIVSMQSGIEMERNRIRSDMHDGLGTTMTLITLQLGDMMLKNKDPEMKKQFEQVQQLVNKANGDFSDILKDIIPRTLTEKGILPAVNEMVEIINSSFENIDVEFYSNIELDSENTSIILNVFRITQELLNNAIKHADASIISLQYLKKGSALFITIDDNGKGFNLQEAIENKSSHGLKNLLARVEAMDGELRVDAHPKRGTFIELEIPYSIFE